MDARTDGAAPGKLKAAARALYRKPPKAEDLAALGMTAEDFAADNVVDLLPDCEMAVDAFCAIGSQWRVGPGGATGLDNTAIRPTLRMAGIRVPPDRWPQLFADLRTLEGEALRTMHESKP